MPKLILPNQFQPEPLDQESFQYLAQLLHNLTGIHLPLNQKNATLISGRLQPILRNRNISDFTVYCEMLGRNPQGALTQEFISAMTTNTTEFFRESKHFDYLSKHLQEILKEKRQTSNSTEFRVWCAASSTGQEPYSILMTLLEAAPQLSQWSLKFLATDIDLDVLKQAARGSYSEADMKGVSGQHREKYFTSYQRNGDLRWSVRPEFRDLIRFAPFNLTRDAYGFQHRFDLIFCRNVLIYFDKPTVQKVVESLVKALAPQGLIFVGHAESGAMKVPGIQTVTHAAYRKTGGSK